MFLQKATQKKTKPEFLANLGRLSWLCTMFWKKFAPTVMFCIICACVVGTRRELQRSASVMTFARALQVPDGNHDALLQSWRLDARHRLVVHERSGRHGEPFRGQRLHSQSHRPGNQAEIACCNAWQDWVGLDRLISAHDCVSCRVENDLIERTVCGW